MGRVVGAWVVLMAVRTREEDAAERRRTREAVGRGAVGGRLLRALRGVAGVGAGWESGSKGVHCSCLLRRRACGCVGVGAGHVRLWERAARLKLLL